MSVNRPVGLIPFVSTTENIQGLARKPLGNIILSNPVYEVARVWRRTLQSSVMGLRSGGIYQDVFETGNLRKQPGLLFLG